MERLEGILSTETIGQTKGLLLDVLVSLEPPMGEADKYPHIVDAYATFHMAFEECIDSLTNNDKFGLFDKNAEKIADVLQPYDRLAQRFVSLLKAWDADLAMSYNARETKAKKEKEAQDEERRLSDVELDASFELVPGDIGLTDDWQLV